MTIEQSIHKTFITQKKTLALAESCTGGHMASRLTAISGASDYFLGSIVAYSNHVKQSVLGVTAEILNAHGAVSREVVMQMVQGTLKLSDADYAVAVSGIAGPTGGTVDKPVGTMWGAIGEKGGKIYTTLFHVKDTMRRDIVIDDSASFLLHALWHLLAHKIPPFEDANGL